MRVILRLKGSIDTNDVGDEAIGEEIRRLETLDLDEFEAPRMLVELISGLPLALTCAGGYMYYQNFSFSSFVLLSMEDDSSRTWEIELSWVIKATHSYVGNVLLRVSKDLYDEPDEHGNHQL